MTSPASALRELAAVLADEELHVRGLADLAESQRSALVRGDYPAILSNVDTMDALVARLDGCGARRAAALTALGADGASLREVEALAALHGVTEILHLGDELRRQAARLRDVQEQNAQLVLSASRLRDRWLAILEVRDDPGYGQGGGASRHRLLSRTA